MAAFALLASAFLHALWNAMLKRDPAPQVAVAGVLVFALAGALVAAAVSPPPPFGTRAALGWAVASGVFEGAYFVTLAAGLARARYGLVYTVARGGALLIVWPASALLVAEPVTAVVLAGVALVVAGLALTSLSGPWAGAGPGLGFAWACAASIASYHLCYGRALAAGAAPAPLFAVALLVALPFALAVAFARRGLIPLSWPRRGSLVRWALAGTVCTGSFLLFLTGLGGSGAGTAMTVRSTSIVFAQIFAAAMGEQVPRRQIVGAAMVAAGAALVIV
jgi:drug/metabolite transporter (DMT)-like permease